MIRLPTYAVAPAAACAVFFTVSSTWQPARAQEPAGPQDRPRIATATTRPVIDGVLEPAAWMDATRLGGFTEVDPDQGDPADPPTEVWLMRDRRTLYLAFVNREPEPSGLVLQNMRRDAGLRDDDRVAFLLDTFDTGRTGYWFQVSAAGARTDALVSDDGQRVNTRWDGRWEARTRIFDDQWVAEIAVPLAGLSFGEQDAWGVNFERFRGNGRILTRWAGALFKDELTTPSVAAPLSGFGDLDPPLGIELHPYFKTRYAVNEADDDSDLFGTLGGEVDLRLTQQLTASVTVNTDFAETETDTRQINIGRFPLFFPEKRDFFLEDSVLFEFGEQLGRAEPANLLPFFSRRIGLSSTGEEVPIDGGARLAGRVGPLDLGLLAVHTGAVDSLGVDDADLFVARPAVHVAEGLVIGGLLTGGHPELATDNTTAGADLRYTDSAFLGGTYSLNVYGVRSSDEALGEVAGAYGLETSLSTRDWVYEFETLATHPDFAPALGFVRRPGEHRYAGRVLHRPRQAESSPFRRLLWEATPEVWTDLSGEVTSYNVALLLLGLEFDAGDKLEFFALPEGDRPDAPFSPGPGSLIAPGEYDWLRGRVRFTSARTRPLSFRGGFSVGDWYDGRRFSIRAAVDWRPSGLLQLGTSYRREEGELPGGDFITHLLRFGSVVSFSPDVSWESLVQYDNASDLLGLQSRFRWIQSDGRELFLVANSAWMETIDDVFVPQDRDLTLKLVYAIFF